MSSTVQTFVANLLRRENPSIQEYIPHADHRSNDDHIGVVHNLLILDISNYKEIPPRIYINFASFHNDTSLWQELRMEDKVEHDSANRKYVRTQEVFHMFDDRMAFLPYKEYQKL